MTRARIMLISLMGCAIFAATSLSGRTQEDSAKPPASSSSPSESTTAESAIRDSAATFIEAFNRQDAKAIAKMWTDDGEYINEDGWRFDGRDAIHREYADFFSKYDGVKLHLAIDTIRMISPTAAIEDGRAQLEPTPQGPPTMSRYTAIHIKQDDGTWKLASVRDTRVEVDSAYSNLQNLEWLVGDWTAEHAGIQADVTCRWMAQKSFLERQITVHRHGLLNSTTTQIIGWDPASQKIMSWTFSSGGGRAVGVWSPHDNGLLVKTQGITSDSTTTTAINVWTPLAGGALGWRSVERSIGGIALEDAMDIVLKPTTQSADFPAASSSKNTSATTKK